MWMHSNFKYFTDSSYMYSNTPSPIVLRSRNREINNQIKIDLLLYTTIEVYFSRVLEPMHCEENYHAGLE